MSVPDSLVLSVGVCASCLLLFELVCLLSSSPCGNEHREVSPRTLHDPQGLLSSQRIFLFLHGTQLRRALMEAVLDVTVCQTTCAEVQTAKSLFHGIQARAERMRSKPGHQHANVVGRVEME